MPRSTLWFAARDARVEAVKVEILRLERQAGNLVRFVAEGGDSRAVRDELRATESALAALRLELAEVEAAGQGAPPPGSPSLGALAPRRSWASARPRRT